MKRILIYITVLVIGLSIQQVKPVFSITNEVSDEVSNEEVNAEETNPIVIKGAKPLVDPFALRISVRRKVEAEAKPLGTAAPGTAPETPQKPKRVIRLEGIWIDATMRVAFISGQALVEGGKVMGWRVAKISRDQVVLTRGGQTKILVLEGIR